jgi:hypothetical protein
MFTHGAFFKLNMDIVKPYIDNLNSISDKLEQEAVNIVDRNKAFIIEYLKDMQLRKGINSLGMDIVHPKGSGYYAESTDSYWSKQAPIPRKPKTVGLKYNMEWTGEFFDSLMLNQSKGSYSILSSNGKDLFLKEVFGGISLTKLTPENNEFINNTIILPKLYEYVLNNLFKI